MVKGEAMKITKKWLNETNACYEGKAWFENQNKDDMAEVCRQLLKENKFEWANWTIAKVMNYKQRVSYAVYAAGLVLPIFEKKFPKDKRPREDIEVAKKCIDNPTEENQIAAYDAYAFAAYDAAPFAAKAANAAAYAAAYPSAFFAYDAAPFAARADATTKPKII